MGYSTDFSGQFNLDRVLAQKDKDFLIKFSETRRMARNVGLRYGTEGEFFVDGKGVCGQDVDKTIINYNQPPSTQPGLWCSWTPTEDGLGIEWNGSEKFYNYIEWLQYLITSYLEPRDYILNGEVEWLGDSSDDRGKIVVKNNKVNIFHGHIEYTKVN